MTDHDSQSSIDHQAAYEWTSVTPSAATLETLAAVTGTDELDLAPLYQSIDPDALDTLVGVRPDGRVAGQTEVAFTHEGYDVVVDSGGTVRLSAADDD